MDDVLLQNGEVIWTEAWIWNCCARAELQANRKTTCVCWQMQLRTRNLVPTLKKLTCVAKKSYQSVC
jgi:hypothetical protein